MHRENSLGKYKLEEETGMAVKFISYQEAHDRPEVQLADVEKTQRFGSSEAPS